MLSNRCVIFDRWEDSASARRSSYVGDGGGIELILNGSSYFFVDEQHAAKWDNKSRIDYDTQWFDLSNCL
jgi:hypothetical protein